jgi:hypothetical protein
VTVYETHAEEQEVEYTVMTPHQVEKEVDVRVCKMVPKTIQVPVSTTGCVQSAGRRCGRWIGLFARRCGGC